MRWSMTEWKPIAIGGISESMGKPRVPWPPFRRSFTAAPHVYEQPMPCGLTMVVYPPKPTASSDFNSMGWPSFHKLIRMIPLLHSNSKSALQTAEQLQLPIAAVAEAAAGISGFFKWINPKSPWVSKLKLKLTCIHFGLFAVPHHLGKSPYWIRRTCYQGWATSCHFFPLEVLLLLGPKRLLDAPLPTAFWNPKLWRIAFDENTRATRLELMSEHQTMFLPNSGLSIFVSFS